MKYCLGLDSTDSVDGGCTTWTLSRIIDLLREIDTSINFIEYPLLIRLNPNIKLKTRGNAALSLTFDSKLGLHELFQSILHVVQSDATKFPDRLDKNPGIILYKGDGLDDTIYTKALNTIVDLKEVLICLSELNNIRFWPDRSLGLIGAFAAMTADLANDFTFELLSYRTESRWGTHREIDCENLKQISRLYPSVFSSYDWDQDRELIAPSGPDPVYYGIRGENVNDLLDFHLTLNKTEEIDSYTIFKTNQATDSHVINNMGTILDQHVFANLVHIAVQPIIQEGGHVKLGIRYDYQEYDLMVFEPSKSLARKASKLLQGDQIFIHANVRENDFGLHFALEYMEIIYLAEKTVYSAPRCACGGKTTSAGKFKGYKCLQCGKPIFRPQTLIDDRELYLGEKCFASVSAQRHLTKPLSRLHRKNTSSDYPMHTIRKTYS